MSAPYAPYAPLIPALTRLGVPLPRARRVVAYLMRSWRSYAPCTESPAISLAYPLIQVNLTRRQDPASRYEILIDLNKD